MGYSLHEKRGLGNGVKQGLWACHFSGSRRLCSFCLRTIVPLGLGILMRKGY